LTILNLSPSSSFQYLYLMSPFFVFNRANASNWALETVCLLILLAWKDSDWSASLPNDCFFLDTMTPLRFSLKSDFFNPDFVRSALPSYTWRYLPWSVVASAILEAHTVRRTYFLPFGNGKYFWLPSLSFLFPSFIPVGHLPFLRRARPPDNRRRRIGDLDRRRGMFG